MLNPISEMIRNINKEKGMFFSSLISLIVVFALLDILLIFFYNLNDFKAKLDSSNQVIVYVKTMTEPEIKEFQIKMNSYGNCGGDEGGKKGEKRELTKVECTKTAKNELRGVPARSGKKK